MAKKTDKIKLSETFILRLIELLDYHEWNQGDLADAIGCTRSYVSQLLSGHRRPGLETLEKLAEIFEIEPSELISRESCI